MEHPSTQVQKQLDQMTQTQSCSAIPAGIHLIYHQPDQSLQNRCGNDVTQTKTVKGKQRIAKVLWEAPTLRVKFVFVTFTEWLVLLYN